jgi:hypothetical protein
LAGHDATDDFATQALIYSMPAASCLNKGSVGVVTL